MNISEFAAIAGVSKSAVSRYFNDGYLSDDKRKQIEEAIEKTGYVPSIQAQNVRTKVTKLIGVIIPKLSSASCARITDGISEVLNEQGYQMILMNTENSPQKEVEFLDFFRSHRVDGVIFLASVFTPLHETLLRKMRIPVVIVGQHLEGFSCVYHDDFGASYALTDLMLSHGRVHPACIGATPGDKAAGQSRIDGFRKAASDHGLTVPDEWVVAGEFKIRSGYEKAKQLLAGENRPDCIFCATDNIAAGAMRYIYEIGLSVPEDVMLASIGDSEICEVTAAPLTSARLHYRTAGNEAAAMVLSLLKRNSGIHRVTKLDYEVIERKSTKL